MFFLSYSKLLKRNLGRGFRSPVRSLMPVWLNTHIKETYVLEDRTEWWRKKIFWMIGKINVTRAKRAHKELERTIKEKVGLGEW